MRSEQRLWTSADGWSSAPSQDAADADVVFVFGSRDLLEEGDALQELRQVHPRAVLFGASTAGEIASTNVTEDTLVATAVRFAHTPVRCVMTSIGEHPESHAAGSHVAGLLPRDGLSHVLVLSDGRDVNGSELARGIQERLGVAVPVTGGLAGDGARFERTLVVAGDDAAEGRIALLGLYGPRVRTGYGSLGGWDPFGPPRLITRSRGNILYELDGQPALALYKRYLGEHAAGLPSTGLLFPLSMRIRDEPEVVRTILGVDEAEQSMTFAGDLPEGNYARLMKANFNRLVDGAMGAARSARDSLTGAQAQLAILISCVGRRLVLRGRTEEELEAVREMLGEAATLTGFYSYGEICPSAPQASCKLHNQTMTITTIRET